MDLRGQRFAIDFSDDEDESATASQLAPIPAAAFIGDIKEREIAPPSAPNPRSTTTGFPEHKKRLRVSAFKQQRSSASSAPKEITISRGSADATSYEETERQKIDRENKDRLASMSANEIEEERRELLEGMNPSLIEKFLRRANLDDGRGDTGIDPPATLTPDKSHDTDIEGKAAAVSTTNGQSAKAIKVEEAVPVPRPSGKPVAATKSVNWADDAEPTKPIGLQPSSQIPMDLPELDHPAVHFPNAPAAPDLDPSDPAFLESLHTKYFPSLPADPTKLAWMAPIPTHGSIADQESPYYPAHEALPASALRFDFRGGLLPPRISRAMPSNKGLHHHGEAPEAAGYTVPELARLARSAFPAQRCVAFQTLGRLLYRLGRGELGDEDGEITKGLWRCMEEGKVVQTLEQAASTEGGHQGSKVYAIEAVWLWQKGGGKVWKAS